MSQVHVDSTEIIKGLAPAEEISPLFEEGQSLFQ